MADFDPEGTGYDMETALAMGMKMNPETKHWYSREPVTGMILKGRGHPTFYLTEQADKEMGYRMYKDETGRYFSVKQRAGGGLVDPAEVHPFVEEHAALAGVNPDLIKQIIKVESNYNPRAVSKKGARGMMQLMPMWSKGIDPFDWRQNIKAGINALKYFQEKKKTTDPAVLAGSYHGGENEKRWKAKTHDYIDKVLAGLPAPTPTPEYTSAEQAMEAMMDPRAYQLVNILSRALGGPTGQQQKYLTGEEGEELYVSNEGDEKELLGKRGPEIFTPPKPGYVYNAQDTQKILGGAAQKAQRPAQGQDAGKAKKPKLDATFKHKDVEKILLYAMQMDPEEKSLKPTNDPGNPKYDATEIAGMIRKALLMKPNPKPEPQEARKTPGNIVEAREQGGPVNPIWERARKALERYVGTGPSPQLLQPKGLSTAAGNTRGSNVAIGLEPEKREGGGPVYGMSEYEKNAALMREDYAARHRPGAGGFVEDTRSPVFRAEQQANYNRTFPQLARAGLRAIANAPRISTVDAALAETTAPERRTGATGDWTAPPSAGVSPGATGTAGGTEAGPTVPDLPSSPPSTVTSPLTENPFGITKTPITGGGTRFGIEGGNLFVGPEAKGTTGFGAISNWFDKGSKYYFPSRAGGGAVNPYEDPNREDYFWRHPEARAALSPAAQEEADTIDMTLGEPNPAGDAAARERIWSSTPNNPEMRARNRWGRAGYPEARLGEMREKLGGNILKVGPGYEEPYYASRPEEERYDKETAAMIPLEEAMKREEFLRFANPNLTTMQYNRLGKPINPPRETEGRDYLKNVSAMEAARMKSEGIRKGGYGSLSGPARLARDMYGKELWELTPEELEDVRTTPGQKEMIDLRRQNLEFRKMQQDENNEIKLQIARMGQEQRGRIPASLVKEMAVKTNTLQQYANLITQFRDDFAGSLIGGPTMTKIYGRLGTDKERVSWWKRFRELDIKIRHELFGATLTANEQSAWDQVTVNENDDPQTVLRTLSDRIRMGRDALAREYEDYASQGYQFPGKGGGGKRIIETRKLGNRTLVKYEDGTIAEVNA